MQALLLFFFLSARLKIQLKAKTPLVDGKKLWLVIESNKPTSGIQCTVGRLTKDCKSRTYPITTNKLVVQHKVYTSYMHSFTPLYLQSCTYKCAQAGKSQINRFPLGSSGKVLFDGVSCIHDAAETRPVTLRVNATSPLGEVSLIVRKFYIGKPQMSLLPRVDCTATSLWGSVFP